MKILEVGDFKSSRASFFSEIATSIGKTIEVESLHPSDVNDFLSKFGYQSKVLFSDLELNHLNDYAGALMSPVWGERLANEFTGLPEDVLRVRFSDAFMVASGRFWPRCLLLSALDEAIRKSATKLNTHAAVYITGHGPQVQPVLDVLIQLGFRKIYLCSSEGHQLERVVAQTSRKYFGVEVNVLDETQITRRPSEASLLINLCEPESYPDLFENLLYLNFLVRGGAVVDLTERRENDLLAHEVQQVEGILIGSEQVFGRVDHAFLSQTLREFEVEQKSFNQKWPLDLFLQKRFEFLK